ncbi:translocation protein TolB [Serratia symbiotica str. 'Cinara cedri']|nr:translocation protein TolB [Serratia symbiotica str. 'Cinara cedri']
MQVFRIVLGVLMLWISVIYAEVHIEITEGVNSIIPIAVVPFRWSSASGTLPEDIGKIVKADLHNSGKFNLINILHIPQYPTSVSEVTPSVWRALGINVLVVGQVQLGLDGSYLISYQLVDISGALSRVLAENQFKVTSQWLRYSAHTISDEIFEKLIETKGAFRTRIAYVVKSNSAKMHYELRVADYDGYNQFTVHLSPEPLMSPVWSPDGNKIAYVTFESGHSELVVQTLSNGEIRQIASFPRHNGAPAFSPDGSRLAFALSKSGSLNLYVMDFSSGNISQITDSRSNNTEPTWFPDGQTLAYTSDQGGRPQIYKISASGGVSQRLTWEGSSNQNSKVSFDGKFLVMVQSNNGVQHIAKQDLQSGFVQVLTDTLIDETPSISPNGNMIIYSAMQGMGSVLYVVSSNGFFNSLLPATNGQVKSPAWSPYL